MKRDPIGGFSIISVLLVSVGVLVGLVVIFMFWASYPIARQNTFELVHEKTRLLIELLVARTSDHLDPAKKQIDYLGEMLARGEIDPADPVQLGLVLRTSLAAVPQVSTISFIDSELQATRAFRHRPTRPIVVSDWRDDPATEQMMREQAQLGGASWGSFFFAESIGETFINVQRPIRRDGRFLGVLVAGVSIRALSEFLLESDEEMLYSPFILHGEDMVLAHPAMITDLRNYPYISDLHPLPALNRFGDPVLSEIWSPARDLKLEESFPGRPSVRAVTFLGRTYLFLFDYLLDYAEKPLIVGAYLHLEDVVGPIRRLEMIPLIGLGIFLISLAVALILGGALSRPIGRIAEAAGHIQALDIDGTPRIKPGPFRELNETSQAFNAMVEGLKLFETYVPRRLVQRLMTPGEAAALESEKREVTVLFTDIVGFTAMAERMTAEAVARLLNENFAIITRQVEAEGGTVDKFIGDAVMAFWDDREAPYLPALSACRAALGIASAVRAENARRHRRGETVIHLRIGIHSGTALIGNIGGPGRINYTVVGDTVNAAERLEALSRELVNPQAEICVLVSGPVAQQVGQDMALSPMGEHKLRGREDAIAVYRLIETRDGGEATMAARSSALDQDSSSLSQ